MIYENNRPLTLSFVGQSDIWEERPLTLSFVRQYELQVTSNI